MSFLDFLSLFGSFFLIVVMLVFTYFASRWYAGKMKTTASSKYIKIVDRVNVGANSWIIIVKAAEKYYLLSSAEKSVRLICELTDFDENKDIDAGNGSNGDLGLAFGEILAKAKSSFKKNNDGGCQ